MKKHCLIFKLAKYLFQLPLTLVNGMKKFSVIPSI